MSTYQHASYILSNGWRGIALNIGVNCRISRKVLFLPEGFGCFVSGVTGTDIGHVELLLNVEEADFILDCRLWCVEIVEAVWGTEADLARRFTEERELLK